MEKYISISKRELIKRLTLMLDFNYHGFDSSNPKRQVCMKLSTDTRKSMAMAIADGLEPEFGKEGA